MIYFLLNKLFTLAYLFFIRLYLAFYIFEVEVIGKV